MVRIPAELDGGADGGGGSPAVEDDCLSAGGARLLKLAEYGGERFPSNWGIRLGATKS